jgi:hypothetical protein
MTDKQSSDYSWFLSQEGCIPSQTWTSLSDDMALRIATALVHYPPIEKFNHSSANLYYSWYASAYEALSSNSNPAIVRLEDRVVYIPQVHPVPSQISTSNQQLEVVNDLDKKIETVNAAYEKEKTIVRNFMGNESEVFNENVKGIIIMVCSLKAPSIDIELRDESTIIFKLKLDSSRKIIIRYHLDEPARCTYSYFCGISSIDNGVGNLKDVILDIKRIISLVKVRRFGSRSWSTESAFTIDSWKNRFVDVLSSRITTQEELQGQD